MRRVDSKLLGAVGGRPAALLMGWAAPLLLAAAAWAQDPTNSAKGDSPIFADTKIGTVPPTEVLEGKGLQRSGKWFLLPEEVQLGKQIHDAYLKKGKMLQAQEQAQRSEARAKSVKYELARLIAQVTQLQAKLPAARGVREHNALVQELNTLSARITVLQAEDPEKGGREAWGQATSAIGEFTQVVLELRRQYDRLTPRYAALATDGQVRQAIQRFNAEGTGQAALGPNTGQQKMLENLESLVLADTVPIRRGSEGLWYVSVIFNGKHTQELAIDSGASIVVLPMKMAQAVGINPGPGAPSVPMTVASGGNVAAKIVFIESMRVGRFVAENVECAVLPEQLNNAPALLGQSFLQRFRQTIDAGRSRWQLASLQDPANPQPNPSAPPKPPEPTLRAIPSADRSEQLRRLLEVTGSDGRATKTVAVQLDSGPVTFRAGRYHEAQGLRQLVGDPDSVRKVTLPHSVEWDLWSWGKVQVLVDPQGMTRYYALPARP